ncbi:MAG: hypothetical protein V4732_17240 [Pseudomonadota bacterium]
MFDKQVLFLGSMHKFEQTFPYSFEKLDAAFAAEMQKATNKFLLVAFAYLNNFINFLNALIFTA